MRIAVGSTVLLLFLVVSQTLVVADGGSEKLRIGVKKRVENCEMRSKKGDRLSMHYTVSDRTLYIVGHAHNMYLVICRVHLRMAQNLIVVYHAKSHSCLP